MIALKTLLSAIPGANYAMMAISFVTTYWRPILLVAAVAVSYHEGVKHEKKRGEAKQLHAQIVKLTFERDNLKSASELANHQMADLQQRATINATLISGLRAQPVTGDCALGADALRRLRRIGDVHGKPGN